MSHLARCLSFALALAASAGVQAALVTSLTFHDQHLTVGPSDSLEIWVTLSVAAESDPLTFDTTADYPFGMDPDLIPTHGNLAFPGDTGTPFVSYFAADVGIFHSCLMYAASGCTWSEYHIDTFGSVWHTMESLTMQPGDSLDFMLATLSPFGDAVTPGTYTMRTLGVDLLFAGFGPDGEVLNAYLPLAETCPDGGEHCRLTVQVVPVPPALWMMGAALVGLGAACRRRPAEEGARRASSCSTPA